MIRIAIVEDNAQDRAGIKGVLEQMARQDALQFGITEFPSGRAFLGSFQSDYDIILLDIEMPGMNGMDMARAIRKMDSTVIIIFVTNLAQYAVDGYEVEALDFVVKPINQYSFAMKMKRAIARTTKRTDEVIQIRTDRETLNLHIAEIRYLEVSGHYVIYHTNDGPVSEYTTLKEAERKIGKSFFVRCNRCYLVNLRYISSVRKDTVIVDGAELVISRPQKKSFLMAFSEYLGGKL